MVPLFPGSRRYPRPKAALISVICWVTNISTTGCKSSLARSSSGYQPQFKLSWSSVALKEAFVSGETAAKRILNSFWSCLPRLQGEARSTCFAIDLVERSWHVHSVTEAAARGHEPF